MYPHKTNMHRVELLAWFLGAGTLHTFHKRITKIWINASNTKSSLVVSYPGAKWSKCGWLFPLGSTMADTTMEATGATDTTVVTTTDLTLIMDETLLNI